MKPFPAILGLLALLILSPVAAETTGCSTQPKQSMQALYAYIQKNGNVPDVYSIAALGNHRYMLDSKYNIESPQEIADKITKDPVYKSAKIVVLLWPYSGWSGAPFARALEHILHKPVKGFAGPLWWYPDGSAFASHAEMSTMTGPDQRNVAECITPDGRYHQGGECRSLLKTRDTAGAIYANLPFMVACDDLKNVEFLADKGDAKANMRLFFFDSFVNIDEKKSALELSKAAIGGDPLADYIVAGMMRDSTPPNTKLYLQFLKHSADGGNEKARAEYEKVSKQQ